MREIFISFSFLVIILDESRTLCDWYLRPIKYWPCQYFGWILELYVIDILGQLNTYHVNIVDEF